MQVLRNILTVTSVFLIFCIPVSIFASTLKRRFFEEKKAMKIKTIKNDLILEDIECFNVGLSVDCGQAFRWVKREDGSFHGVIFKKAVDIVQNENEIIFKNTDEKAFHELLSPYFDLERDYAKICASFDDKYLKEACNQYNGIRILHQEPWEALCSFIISQNNNIPRIKGIIERLCSSFGEQIGESDFSFPSCERLAPLSEEELAPLRAGFRNKYILDAARKVACGEVDFEKIKAAPFDEARQELLKIKGVGEKVAQCALLYGFGRMEAFPVDVWVKRILSELYPDGFPQCAKGVEGIAQQYLFHWRRNLKE